MPIFLKQAAVTLIVLSLLLMPLNAVAADHADRMRAHSSGEMIADGILVRPLGIVSLVAGFGIFIISSPFSALGGNIGEAWDTLVVEPATFTFARPLGEF
ncbi:MAG: hypothetical protein PVJ84_00780 [Desulfobacteraceae bacterium]|jgi:hypothetical protein